MIKEAFEISEDYIELNKLLKASGVCSTGGMAKIAIESGDVKVDGEIEFRKRTKLKPNQVVTYEEYVITIK